MVLSRTLHLQRKERNCACNSLAPLWQLWVLQAHMHPRINPARPALLCRDAAPCSSWAVGVNTPGNRNPWLAMATPQFPSSLACWDLPVQLKTIFYVFPSPLLKHWVHLPDGWHRQCSVHLPSSLRKNNCRYFLNCSQTPSLTILFSFLPCSLKVQVSLWPQDCWSLALLAEFGCWWVGTWLREHQGAELE